MKMRIGNLLIALSFLFVIELFLLSKTDISVIFDRPWLSLAQISALLGAVSFSITFVLSSRIGFLESLFGGLDTVYRVHQRMGRVSFMLLSIHLMSLLSNYIGVPVQLGALLFPSTEIAYTAGILSFWLLTFILALVIFARLEYQLFVKVQTFFIISFALGLLHSLLIESDISRYMPLRIYMLSFFALGIFSFLYRQLLYSVVGPKHSYIVSMVKQLSNGWVQLRFTALGRQMRYIPGQFVYIGFEEKGYGKESHPFSIVSSPGDEYVELWIKPVGDFTHTVEFLRVGDKAELYGPYGTLYEKIFGKKTVVCIAGGIGITPFVGMIRFFSKQLPDTMFHLFYSVRSQKDIGVDIGQLLSSGEPNIRVHTRITEESGRLTAEEIIQHIPYARNTMYLLCGPVAMMDQMKNQLFTQRVHPRTIAYEEFNY